ncbi:MAG: CDP-alcohol phosphatidyltransferase family protein [Simkaniaceae bacterium]|nr:CDP-alcohol phosphatidyltransferase family protein [Simkaniaceae bacterium]
MRGPLGLLFLIDNPFVRISAIVLAMVTDIIDGYLARKWKLTSRLGRLLDPAMDKVFVLTVLAILLFEHKIAGWQIAMMLSRDIALIAFGVILIASFKLTSFKFKPAKWGKISTAMQFIILIILSIGYPIPSYIYFLFAPLGLLVFIELCCRLNKKLSY